MSQPSAPLPDSLSERAARHERFLVLAGLALVAAGGLAATLRVGGWLMAYSAPSAGSAAFGVLLFVMWWTMMMAMMLPSAAPAILTYGAMSRKFASTGAPSTPVAVFALGYAAIWTGFSVLAVTLQLLTSTAIRLNGMMAVTSAAVGGGLLIAAGLYQLSPLKHACLRKCQSPLMFFARNWREGVSGAFRMGWSHGLHCLGCCWVLMGLLFYGGVMEPSWIVGIAVFIAIEKLSPVGGMSSRFAGAFLIALGLWTLVPSLS